MMIGRFLRQSLFRRAKVEPDVLSTELLRWSRDDSWTVRDAVEGTLILGATGAGKTTGPGRAMALAMLKAGFSGLVMTAKSDEAALWESYARAAGRLDDLIVVNPSQPWKFNFLQYECERKGVGAGLVHNVENLLCTVAELGDRGQSQSGGLEGDRYWRDAMKELARAAIHVLMLAKGRVSVPDLYQLIVTAPSNEAEKCSRQRQQSSFCYECFTEAARREKSADDERDFLTDCDFFLQRFPRLAPKTRSIIESVLMSMVDLLNRGVLRRLFCSETNFTPEFLDQGKLIVIDLPIFEYGAVGLYGQGVVKYCFQKSLQRRTFSSHPTPAFIWIDECHYFLMGHDAMFASTCRSANVALCLLSQNVSNFYAALGGAAKAQNEADSLFGNLNTKVLLANGDAVSNTWSANLLGRSRQFLASGNSSYDNDHRWAAAVGLDWLDGGGSTSAGFSEVFEYEVQPREWTTLRTGGPAHSWMVDAIVFQHGRRFKASGRNWLRTSFRQKP